MLRKTSYITAIALGALVLLSTQLHGTVAAEAGFDQFGIEKIYPTKTGGNEWFVDMDNPTSDLKNVRNVNFAQNDDGSWKVSARQIRMEAWSPPGGEKWQNVEITGYARMEEGSNQLLQFYSRGGHHSNNDQCSGSAYKARLFGDGRAAWTKEITHPAYAGNRGMVQVTDDLLGRWIGFKAVMYNFVENGQTFVRLESYIDDDVTDANGNLVVANNWTLASVVEDRGGWTTPDADFNSSCGKARDAILTEAGGSGSQNIAAFRSDGLIWSFKYLSVREISANQEQTVVEQPTPILVGEENTCLSEGRILGCTILASQQFPDGNNISTIESISISLDNPSSNIMVAIVRGDQILASQKLEVTANPVFVHFSPAVSIGGQGFDTVVLAPQGTTGTRAIISGWSIQPL